jgi:multiple sugar transport system permease protein
MLRQLNETITPASEGQQTHIRARRSVLARREALYFYLFMSPWILGFLGFYLGPMVASFVLSLTAYDAINPPLFIGLQNYAQLFTRDPLFYHSLVLTLYYAAGSVAFSIIFGLTLALMMNIRVRGVMLARVVFYLPSVISGVAVALLFIQLFDPTHGLFNSILQFVFHVQGPGWFGDPSWVMPAIIIMVVWRSLGTNMVLYLAGLQAVPTELYEAATIDGAGAARQFRNVTLPIITPIIFFNLVISLIGALQGFAEVFVATDSQGGPGGPANASYIISINIYSNAFRFFQMGYASALSWVIFVIIMAVTILLWTTSNRWVYYQGN